jgi:cellulase/cellobiase CelA1
LNDDAASSSVIYDDPSRISSIVAQNAEQQLQPLNTHDPRSEKYINTLEESTIPGHLLNTNNFITMNN